MRRPAERPALKAALDAAKLPARRPTEDDRPPVSTFPMTPAAKAALRTAGKLND